MQALLDPRGNERTMPQSRARRRTGPRSTAPLGKLRQGEARSLPPAPTLGAAALLPPPAPPAAREGRGARAGPWDQLRARPGDVGRSARAALPETQQTRCVHRLRQHPGVARGGGRREGGRRGGAYWVTSVRSSLPPKLSWWIWCQERRPTGACRGEVAAPASAWAGSGWALSLDHFHLTGDTTQTKNKQQKPLGRHRRQRRGRAPRGAERPSVTRVWWGSEQP